MIIVEPLKFSLAQTEIEKRTIGILDLMVQVCPELQQALLQGNVEMLQQLINDLEAALQVYEASFGNAEELPPHTNNVDLIENVLHSLDKFVNAVNSGNIEKANQVIEFEVYPFLCELRETFYFWVCAFPDTAKRARYFEEEFASHHKNVYTSSKETKYKLSLFVPAYNKLDYTKKCVESILEYTPLQEMGCELILLNHGSTDDTQAYFDSLENVKVVEFKKNVRMSMFSTAYRVTEGEYTVFVSNDTVVTKDWLAILYACVQSGEDIISATPVTPNISNYQAMPENYKNLTEMQAFAKKYNKLNPKKWHHRCKMMPVIALYNNALVNQIGFADRMFYSMEFWDDDFSLRARRKGFKQILCKDVFCHHFGSVTGKEAQKKENTIELGKRLFTEKYQVDPWVPSSVYDKTVLSMFTSASEGGRRTHYDILSIDGGFGDTCLEMRNVLREIDVEATIYGISTQEEYKIDQMNTTDSFHFTSNLLEGLEEAYDGKLFDTIYVCLPVEMYLHWEEMLEKAKRRLKKDGFMYATLTNPYSANIIGSMLSMKLLNNRNSVVLLSIDALGKKLQESFLKVAIVGGRENLETAESFYKRFYDISQTEAKETVCNVLATNTYTISCSVLK